MKKLWIILGVGSALVGTVVFYFYDKTMKEIDNLDFSNLSKEKL